MKYRMTPHGTKASTPPPQVDGVLRRHGLRVPHEIYRCSGILVNGRRIKSLVFSTDVCIICNVNADAVIAVYPFTPQPVIIQSVMVAARQPVFAGVGGGLTTGKRAVNLAMVAEMQGAAGVVFNAPTANEVLQEAADRIDIPIILTVANENVDIDSRIKAGTAIFNVSGASKTPELVRMIRREVPDFPIIATGGPSGESILETIEAGANAITWTPPSNGEIFRGIMDRYRRGQGRE